MSEFEPYKYYATIHERLRRLDGTKSHYERMRKNSTAYLLDEQINTKTELVDAVKAVLNRIVDTTANFTMTETEHGFLFERYIKWSADEFDYTIEKPGEHSDHETYIVDISYYVEQPNPVQFLEKMDKIRAELAVPE